MTKIYENYSDPEYQLYEIVGWAMIGLIDTENLERPSMFGGFLHDLFLDPRGGELSGEPGWSLERINLDENFLSKHPYIQAESIELLNEFRKNGETQAFWMEVQGQDEHVVSSLTFWKVVADSFNEFVKARPDKKKELDLIVATFPQLLAE